MNRHKALQDCVPFVGGPLGGVHQDSTALHATIEWEGGRYILTSDDGDNLRYAWEGKAANGGGEAPVISDDGCKENDDALAAMLAAEPNPEEEAWVLELQDRRAEIMEAIESRLGPQPEIGWAIDALIRLAQKGPTPQRDI